jgi:hypothetical protein
MADAAAFDFICERLEARTSLDRLAARGTVRIALKQAGLDPGAVTPEQMGVVAEKVLAPELATRGVPESQRLCSELARQVRKLEGGALAEAPDAVFRRLGG